MEHSLKSAMLSEYLQHTYSAIELGYASRHVLSLHSQHFLTVDKYATPLHHVSALTSLLQAACFDTSQACLHCTKLKLVMFINLAVCMQAAGLVDVFNSSNQQLTLFASLDIKFKTPNPQVSSVHPTKPQPTPSVLCLLTATDPGCSCKSSM